MFSQTTATKKIKQLSKRTRLVCGGTSASKTISILLYLIARAQHDKAPTLTSIVSESFPHLKRGAMRDFLNIMESHGYFNDARWNKTDYTYTFETGSKIEFFSADQPGKVRGPRRDRLFCNEVNNIPREAWEQLVLRTKEMAFADWNPVADFYLYEDYGLHDDPEVYALDHDTDFLVLTYKDNEALDSAIVNEIEKRALNNIQWGRVYAQGIRGEVEGKIYRDWNILDELPHQARLERYGLDFGYSNDPTAIVAIYSYNGGYIVDEIAFQKGLSNKQIADILNAQEKALVIADAAEPKSIDELKMYGVMIVPAKKGPGSVSQGIQYVQQQRMSITKRSTNLIKEYRNYLWLTDREGHIINEPAHEFSHCFAPETLVHTTRGKVRIDSLVGTEGYLYSRDGLIKRYSNVRPTRRNAEVVSLHMSDGDILTVTPDHEVLTPSGEWVQAGCIKSGDLIQSVTYGKTENKPKGLNSYQLPRGGWVYLLSIRNKILQGIRQWQKTILAPIFMGKVSWGYTQGLSHSSQGWQQGKQFHREPGVHLTKRTRSSSYDWGEIGEAEGTRQEYRATHKKMACIKRGQGMAPSACTRSLRKKTGPEETLRSLWGRVSDNSIRKVSKVLWPELQNEGTTKTVERITRGSRSITYDLEVEGTHCLLANGVIAHNSMDAIRYGMDFLRPKPQRVQRKGSYDPHTGRRLD